MNRIFENIKTVILDPELSIRTLRQQFLVFIDQGSAPTGSNQEQFPLLPLHQATLLMNTRSLSDSSSEDLFKLCLETNQEALTILSARATAGDLESQNLVLKFEKSGVKFPSSRETTSYVPLEAWPTKYQKKLTSGPTKPDGHHPKHWNV